MTKKKEAVDLSKLSAGDRIKLKRFLKGDKRALRKRDKALGLRFASADVEAWHAAASRRDETITDWMERVCNAAATSERAAG